MTDGKQIDNIIRLMKEKKAFSSVIQLHKTLIRLFMQNYSIDHPGICNSCKQIDLIYHELKTHDEAIDFWFEMQAMFLKDLDWIHERVLISCDALSAHHAADGIQMEPAQFTRVLDFIRKEIPDCDLTTNEWDRDKVISLLFKIVYLSRTNESETQAVSASAAITILNFMNVSFSKMDLAQIRIPRANLRHAILDGADLTGAILDGVDFTDSVFGDCILDKSSMANTRFGILKQELKGHTDSVYAVCSIDGSNGEQLIASGSRDGSIRIWDLATCESVFELTGHTSFVNSVCFTKGPNGERWLGSGSKDKTIRIWDLDTVAHLRTLQGHSDSINTVCSVTGPNGEHWLASGGDDNTVRIWDWITGDQVASLDGHTWCVRSICSVTGPNGERWLASGSNDKTIRIWDLHTLQQIRVLHQRTAYVYTVCPLRGPDGESWLASGGNDKTIRIWDYTSGAHIKTLRGHGSSVYCLSGSNGPSGRDCWLISGGGSFGSDSGYSDTAIRVWDVAIGAEIRRVNRQTQAVYGLCPVGDWFASASEDRSVCLYGDLWSMRRSSGSVRSRSVYTLGADYVARSEEGLVTLGGRKRSVTLAAGHRHLTGGRIQFRHVGSIGMFSKRMLLAIGAVSFDPDFVAFCEAGRYTKFQAECMKTCYESGLGVGVGVDAAKAEEWSGRAQAMDQ